MNVPMSWLKQYVSLDDIDLNTYIDAMTMSGTKVEAVEEIGKEITRVVAGKILEESKHPNADKLRIMKVDVNGDELLQIVTAATNVKVGDVVPVALDGATLAKGVVIKKGKLRGEVSEGMFCSVEELGFNASDIEDAPEDGVYVFHQDITLGRDVKPYFGLGEHVVEYEVTSNRPDCFSIIGIAREAAATFNRPFMFPKIEVKETEGNAKDMAKISIENPDLCPRYAARIIKNVTVEPSPKWLKDRLISAGLRPINNIVDITNYMLLEFGQPMHAFDYDKLTNHEIIVRNAKDNETIITLLGDEVTLDNSMLVIADSQRPVAIAGIMGGDATKVTENTKTILFECANFNAYNIRQTSKKLAISSDSSKKYVKGLDPNNVELALERAAQLISEIGAGEVVKGKIDVYPKKRVPVTIDYDSAWINCFLGTDIDEEEMISYFKALEFTVDKEAKKVTIPTFRPDITMKYDLAEEVARLYGYDKIPVTLERGKPTVGVKTFEQLMQDKIKEFMTMNGVSGAMTYTFESPKIFDRLGISKDSPLRNTLTIKNPLGEDFSIMRTTTLNGMLVSLSTNYNRRNDTAALYEIGKIFEVQGENELPKEIKKLTIGMYGKEVDFYSLKGLIESLMQYLRITSFSVTRNTDIEFMHPGRCANIILENKEIGFFGEVHPKTTKNYDIGMKVYVAEMDLEGLLAHINKDVQYKALPKYPAISRDIAMLVKDEVLVGDIEKVITQRGTKLLEKVELFDVYKGKQIEEGYKSVAYNLTFRAADRTLTDEEVQKAMKKILLGLEQELEAKLRDQ